MTNTAYIFQEKNACHAYEYERDEGDSEESGGDRPPGPHDWYEYDYGEETFFATRPDGGLYSNPRDFIKWEKALPSLLNQDLLKEAYTPKIKTYGSPWSDYQNRYGTYYGYGWFIEPEKKCIYHTGDNGGFKILAAKCLDKNAFVVVFAARADWDRYRFKTQIEEIFDLIPKITEKVNFILKDLSVMDDDGEILAEPMEYILGSEEEIRAYLRGAFLSKGSINDPKTSRYHLEFLIEEKEEAHVISDLLNLFELNSKIISRDKGYMVYVKEAEKIGDFLRIISANQAVLYYEDIRIYRDHKNMTNRLNNMEQANIEKTINTAVSQINDINLLMKVYGDDLLEDKIKEVCKYRIKYPESSLQELSEIMSNELGKNITKSGLNHRFRKIREMANRIKKSEK